MRIDIMTLFPETVGDMMNESILGRARSGATSASRLTRSETSR